MTLGTAAEGLLDQGLGANVGGLFEAELDHYVRAEWATSADDVLWRRTKMGLHIGPAGRTAVAGWFGETAAVAGIDEPVRHRFATPGA
jgi:glycerol-3-phosphate dehydrogenase